MFRKTLHRFRSLPRETKSMIFLLWIFTFVQIITDFFINIFVFQQTQSIGALITYNGVYFFACMLGFCVWGLLVARWKISMRLNFLKSFFVLFISFFLLIFLSPTLPTLLSFGFVNGLGLGMFWLGVHTFEMIFTKEENRDFYSSMISAGDETLNILAPLMAVIAFFVSKNFLQMETFQLLFLILPLVYLITIPFLFKLKDFTPLPIKYSEVKKLFTDPQLKSLRLYYFWGDFTLSVGMIAKPVIAISVLGSVIKIGIFETIMGIFSILFVIFLSHKRHENNRIKILWYSIFALWGALLLMMFYSISFYFYLFATLIIILALPVFNVSRHVLDLHGVETMKSTCFFPGLLYRDWILFLSRMTVFGVLGLFYWISQNETQTVLLAILMIAFSYGIMGKMAERMMQKTKN